MNGRVSKSSEVLLIYGKLTADTLTPRVRCGVRLNLYQDSCEKKEAPKHLDRSMAKTTIREIHGKN